MAYRPAVYDGWQAEETNGFLTKRSLLPTFADQGQGERSITGRQALPAFEADHGAEDGGGGRLPGHPAFIAFGIAGMSPPSALVGLRFRDRLGLRR